jgi:hypothetical protein
MRWIIKSKTLKNNDYGTNYYANKELKESYRIRPNEIYIEKFLKGRTRRRTIVHEKIEAYMMKEKHLPYKKAHHIALIFEKNIQ